MTDEELNKMTLSEKLAEVAACMASETDLPEEGFGWHPNYIAAVLEAAKLLAPTQPQKPGGYPR